MENMMSIYHEGLQTFCLGRTPNSWITMGDLRVYMRKGVHTLPPLRAVRNTFDIASVEVTSDKRGNGIFTEFLKVAEDLARENGFDAVYVENLLNPRLASFLARRGYTQMGSQEVPSFFRYCSD